MQNSNYIFNLNRTIYIKKGNIVNTKIIKSKQCKMEIKNHKKIKALDLKEAIFGTDHV